jgi:hypothetical protein
VGSYEFPEYGCSGILRLDAVERDTIAVTGYVNEQTSEDSYSCDDGPKLIRYLNENQIFFSYESNGGGEGTLDRFQ